MPLLHCQKCHHEWESIEPKETCDWCGNESYMLAEKTDIEKMSVTIKTSFQEELEKIKPLFQRQDALLDQLYDLIKVGNKLGLYDACDYITNIISKYKTKKGI